MGESRISDNRVRRLEGISFKWQIRDTQLGHRSLLSSSSPSLSPPPNVAADVSAAVGVVEPEMTVAETAEEIVEVDKWVCDV